VENAKLIEIKLLLQDFPKLKTWLSATNNTRYLDYAYNEIDDWKKKLEALIGEPAASSQKVHAVVTVFQGLFDDVEAFSSAPNATLYAEKVKADYPGESGLEVVRKEIEVKPTLSEREEKFKWASAEYLGKLKADKKSA
jgi:hypothetical protein